MRVVLLADTHIPGHARELPRAVLRALERCDAIVHAGDVDAAPLLDELATYAPVHVALGNNDGPDVSAWGARDELRLDLDGVAVGVVHDSGPRDGREPRLRRRFPDERVVVFGHSHIPMAYQHDGCLLVNPGSPTWKRRQPRPTYAILTLTRREPAARIVEI